MRIVVATMCCFALLAGVPAAHSTTDPDVVVAVLDTGLDPRHQEFTYGGPSDPSDQIVAWWDFTRPHPAPELWDTRVADPYDGHGHGTGVASLAVGQNKAPFPTKEPSFAPGYKLAVGKVATDSGTVSGNIAQALRWAVDTAGADVVNISIGAAIPIPGLLSTLDEAIAYARQAGVLVVVANGNGWGNLGIPGQPGWASYFSPTDALSVGAQGLDGVLVSTDPEVTGRFSQVGSARAGTTNLYVPMSGTSFSAPLVAGMAAALRREALVNSLDASPARIEHLLKWSARDTVIPPSNEGYGLLNAAEFAAARGHAAAGTVPPAPPSANTLYVETVANGLRDAWTKTLDGGARMLLAPTGVESGTATGTIGPSSPYGLADADVYRIEPAQGQAVTIGLGYDPVDADLSDVHDIDLYVFRGPGPRFTGEDLVDRSTNSAGEAESLTFTSPTGGEHWVVAIGWMVARDQGYSISSSTPMTSAGGGFYAVHSSQGL